MDPAAALQTLHESLKWTGTVALSVVLAGLCIAAYIAWFTWIIQAQMVRLRNGDIEFQTLLTESGRALLVTLAVIATVAFLQN